MQIQIDQESYEVLIQSTKKKELSLTVTKEGLITVNAPKKSTREEIEAFVKKHASKLKKTKDRIENRKVLTRVKTYEKEEQYLLFGKPYSLTELLGELPENEDAIKQALKQFYTDKTKEVIQRQLAVFEPIIGVKSKGFKIVDSPASWGTCDSNKNLTFNYRLSMAKPSSIDYVVIHELCHILHMNHDRSFWRKVGTYDKEYKAHQEYLAYFGGVMTI